MHRAELLTEALRRLRGYDPHNPLSFKDTIEVYEALAASPPAPGTVQLDPQTYRAQWAVVVNAGLLVMSDLLELALDAEKAGQQELLDDSAALGSRLQAVLQTLNARQLRFRPIQAELRQEVQS